MKTLNLTLNKMWFDMIASGEKKEEYREIKPYWIRRFIDTSNYPKEYPLDGKSIADDICYDILELGNRCFKNIVHYYHSDLKHFDIISANNGYSKNCSNIKWKHEGITIGEGKPEWGAEPGKIYFILKIGELI